jgi:creatinine amidohydrolase
MNLADLTWPQVQALPHETPVVVPIAALEQHGPHLPLFTDSLLLGELVRRSEQRLRDRVLFAPLMWLGNSEHHLDFPGTLSAAPRSYLELLKDCVRNCLMHGFRRIVLLNGHGGNIVPSQQALFELRQETRDREDLVLLAATYWQLGPSPQEAMPELSQSTMGHACEWETSMMLVIRPDLVGDYASLPEVSREQPLAPAHQAWTTRDRSEAGYLGDPAAANVEKGQFLLDRFTENVVSLLERI